MSILSMDYALPGVDTYLHCCTVIGIFLVYMETLLLVYSCPQIIPVTESYRRCLLKGDAEIWEVRPCSQVLWENDGKWFCSKSPHI